MNENLGTRLLLYYFLSKVSFIHACSYGALSIAAENIFAQALGILLSVKTKGAHKYVMLK